MPTPHFQPCWASQPPESSNNFCCSFTLIVNEAGSLQVINSCQHSGGFGSIFPSACWCHQKRASKFCLGSGWWSSVLVLITTCCLSVHESLSEVHQKPRGVWDLGYICRANKHTWRGAGFPGWGNGLWRGCGVEGSLSNQHYAAQATSPNYRPAWNFQLHSSWIFYFFKASRCLSKRWILWGEVRTISLSPQWLEEQNFLHTSHSYDYELKDSVIKPHCGQLACSVLLSPCPTGKNSSQQVRRERRIQRHEGI